MRHPVQLKGEVESQFTKRSLIEERGDNDSVRADSFLVSLELTSITEKVLHFLPGSFERKLQEPVNKPCIGFSRLGVGE